MRAISSADCPAPENSRGQRAIFLLHPTAENKIETRGRPAAARSWWLSKGAPSRTLFSAGITSAPRAKSKAASNHATAMNPSNPVQNQCNCEFPPARAQRTRYAITLHVALCFHRRRRTLGSRARLVSPPPGMARRLGGHALCGSFAGCDTRDRRRAAVRHTYKRSDGCRCYSVTDTGRCSGGSREPVGEACGRKNATAKSCCMAAARWTLRSCKRWPRRGAATGSIHPMQTFTNNSQPNMKDVVFAVEGDPPRAPRSRRDY